MSLLIQYMCIILEEKDFKGISAYLSLLLSLPFLPASACDKLIMLKTPDEFS